jgi:hypothetical protein
MSINLQRNARHIAHVRCPNCYISRFYSQFVEFFHFLLYYNNSEPEFEEKNYRGPLSLFFQFAQMP